MRKDVMAGADLAVFAEVALFLFILAFVAIVIRALLMKKAEISQFERMPLEDGTISASREVRQ